MKRLILRGVDFGSVLVASGTLNFFGEGWPYHRIYKMLFRGFDFSGATFVAKTTSLNARAGNMPLNENLQPKELFPRCIKVSFRRQTVLNSVGLSGPGADALLDSMKWQQRIKPFFISFMAVGKTKEDRLEETRIFAAKLKQHLGNFNARIGLQVNISCPNADHDPEELAHEAVNYLEIVFPLGIPIDLKINALTPIKAARMIVATGLLDSLTVSNTIPFGKLPEFINWKKLFGTSLSPLAEFGGGGAFRSSSLADCRQLGKKCSFCRH